MAHKNKKGSNLNLAIGFIGLVIFIVIISFIFKVFWVVKESQFDGTNKFNLQITDSRGTGVISFSPKEKSISILKIEENMQGSLAKNLKVPIDGYLNLKNKNFNYSNISSSLFINIFSLPSTHINLTYFDIIRLSLFTRTVSPNFIYERKLVKEYSDLQKSTILSLTFKDPAIVAESMSIEVVNGTEVSGLGTNLANLVTNMGGNVVLVGSKDLQKESKIIYFKKNSYTAKKLSNNLNFPLEETGSRGLADVIIIIGEDSLDRLKF